MTELILDLEWPNLEEAQDPEFYLEESPAQKSASQFPAPALPSRHCGVKSVLFGPELWLLVGKLGPTLHILRLFSAVFISGLNEPPVIEQ